MVYVFAMFGVIIIGMFGVTVYLLATAYEPEKNSEWIQDNTTNDYLFSIEVK
ncbi:hypothetical protein LCGC14_0553790 [marine sediment metagenome]|uniref:Uncharacterized protein n=1 Tax=marine sediment metagenome TaxID=412755 RepID=A0A0F9RU90_9ZZZZ